MGSVRCPAAASESLPSLEARVDHLSQKLDQLFSRENGGCPICSTCSLHTSQWEAAERQFSAQSKLLERMERRIGEMQWTLEGLVRGKGVEQRAQAEATTGNPFHGRYSQESHREGERKVMGGAVAGAMAVPSTVVTQKTKIMSNAGKADTINELATNHKLGWQGTKQQTLTTPTKKGEPFSTREQPIGVNLQEVRGQVVSAQMTVTQTEPTSVIGKLEINQQALRQPHHAAPSKRGDKLPTAELPIVLIGGNSQAVRDQPMAVVSVVTQPMTVPQRTKPILFTGKTDTTNHVEIQQQCTKQRPLTGSSKNCGKGPTAEPRTAFIGGNSQEVRGQPKSASQKPSETSAKGEASVAVAPNQSMQVPPKMGNKVTENKTTAVTSQLMPQKQCGLSVPTAAALRQVHSCPESLQRLQCPGPMPQSICSAPGPSLGKSSGVMPASGIQIRVVPAAPDGTTPKSPPITCHKVIDDVSPQSAPFLHRCVSLRSNPSTDAFILHTREVLGGGRFGNVHRCTEKSSGLRLAAKVINTRNSKEREMALTEVQVMNQLSHANILQLYEAFETKNQVVLILEYVEGGELFDRIVDESSPLTEPDAMAFVKQICEGVHYMHQMFVLHLDLKPENILCVNRTGHQVKIIDFGLARRYRPRDKLRVNFGTTEFLAPEVVNFDFVSFPTDMWALGVVTYMLLSGMSPFLGDDDSQTLGNVLDVNWYFEEMAFENISAEARDFISNLLVREKGGRLSAAQCLKHPWLNNISEKAKHSNIVLKSQVLLKKYMAKRLWKKNYIAIAAANRFKKIGSSGSLTSLGI